MPIGNRPSLARRLALSAAVAVLSMAPIGGASNGVQAAMAASRPPDSPSRAAAPAGAPSTTSSFYVYGSFIDVCGPSATKECPLYEDAAAEVLPAAGGMTILDFGAPCFEPATLAWGTQLFNSQSCTPDGAIVTLAQAWLRGYATNPNLNRTASTSYVLVVGTSNSLTAADPGGALTPDAMAQHAQAWFNSVVIPVAAAAAAGAVRVTIWAGDDIEQSRDGNWYDGRTTTAWVDAYATASGASKPCVPARSSLLVDYGDYVPNVPGWSPADIYHVSWEAAPACPVPEIYQAPNAAEWQSLNAYASTAGLPPLEFTGVLSEDGAEGTLSSGAGWAALRNASGQSAPYLSVIGVTGPIPPVIPDPPTAVTVSPGPGLITLSWTAPAWDGGAGVAAYTVTVYAGSVVAQVVTLSGFPVPEKAMVTGLAGGASYTFYVSATNRAGAGPQSLPSRGVPLWSPIFP